MGAWRILFWRSRPSRTGNALVRRSPRVGRPATASSESAGTEAVARSLFARIARHATRARAPFYQDNGASRGRNEAIASMAAAYLPLRSMSTEGVQPMRDTHGAIQPTTVRSRGASDKCHGSTRVRCLGTELRSIGW